MSETTHGELVRAAGKWLKKTGHSVIVEEMVSCASETPDAIGFKSCSSTLVECKASRSDFLADRKKYFRRNPEYGMGARRYYLCPHGLVAPEELPEKWGLIYYKDGKTRTVKELSYLDFHRFNVRSERLLLFSLGRRQAKKITSLEQQCKEYREALEFYGFEGNFVSPDCATDIYENTVDGSPEIGFTATKVLEKWGER